MTKPNKLKVVIKYAMFISIILLLIFSKSITSWCAVTLFSDFTFISLSILRICILFSLTTMILFFAYVFYILFVFLKE